MTNKTVKALNVLAKIKRLEMFEKQKALGEMQAEIRTLNQKVKDISQTRAQEIEASRQDTCRLTLQIYLDSLAKEEVALKKRIYHLADFMIPVQESVRVSFKEVKSLEFESKRIHDEIVREAEKKEQDFLDEISQKK